MAYRLNYSDYSTTTGPPDPAAWVGPPGPMGPPGPPGPMPPGGPFLPLTGGTVSGPLNYTATGGTTSRSAQDRAAEVVNVKDYGAKGDGVTDDTAAINAALNYVRVHAVADHTTVRVTFPAGRYIVTAPLNFTGIANWYTPVIIDGCGSELWLKSATAVVDCFSSRWLTFQNLAIFGDPTSTPKVGIQLGRTGSVQGDFITLINVKCGGNFTFAGLYNFASETMTAYACTFNNLATTAGAFCAVLDGINHWNVLSTFVTVSAPANTIQSNNSITFDCCTFQGNNTGNVVWLAHTNAHAFRRCYASNSGGSPFVIYQDASGQATAFYLEIECHCETAALQHMVQFTGAAGVTYALVIGFLLSDYDMPASASVLSVDTSSALTTVEIRHTKFRISGNCPALFDTPAKYVVHSDEAFLSDAMWASPNYWDGPVDKINSPNKSFNVARKWTTSARPSPVVAGAEGFATDTNRFEFYDGTTWQQHVRLGGDVMTGALSVVPPAGGAPPIFWSVNQAGIIPTVSNGGYLSSNQSGGYAEFSLVNSTVGPSRSFAWFQYTSTTSISQIAYLTPAGGFAVIGGLGAFNATPPTTKPTVTGAKGSNAALASLLTALAAYGLVTDSTSA